MAAALEWTETENGTRKVSATLTKLTLTAAQALGKVASLLGAWLRPVDILPPKPIL